MLNETNNLLNNPSNYFHSSEEQQIVLQYQEKRLLKEFQDKKTQIKEHSQKIKYYKDKINLLMNQEKSLLENEEIKVDNKNVLSYEMKISQLELEKTEQKKEISAVQGELTQIQTNIRMKEENFKKLHFKKVELDSKYNTLLQLSFNQRKIHRKKLKRITEMISQEMNQTQESKNQCQQLNETVSLKRISLKGIKDRTLRLQQTIANINRYFKILDQTNQRNKTIIDSISNEINSIHNRYQQQKISIQNKSSNTKKLMDEKMKDISIIHDLFDATSKQETESQNTLRLLEQEEKKLTTLSSIYKQQLDQEAIFDSLSSSPYFKGRDHSSLDFSQEEMKDISLQINHTQENNKSIQQTIQDQINLEKNEIQKLKNQLNKSKGIYDDFYLKKKELENQIQNVLIIQKSLYHPQLNEDYSIDKTSTQIACIIKNRGLNRNSKKGDIREDINELIKKIQEMKMRIERVHMARHAKREFVECQEIRANIETDFDLTAAQHTCLKSLTQLFKIISDEIITWLDVSSFAKVPSLLKSWQYCIVGQVKQLNSPSLC